MVLTWVFSCRCTTLWMLKILFRRKCKSYLCLLYTCEAVECNLSPRLNTEVPTTKSLLTLYSLFLSFSQSYHKDTLNQDGLHKPHYWRLWKHLINDLNRKQMSSKKRSLSRIPYSMTFTPNHQVKWKDCSFLEIMDYALVKFSPWKLSLPLLKHHFPMYKCSPGHSESH